MAGTGERELEIQRGGGGGRPVAQVRAVRKDGWSKAAQARFIDVLRATANVTASARAAGKSSKTAYDLRKRNRGFDAAWEEALEQGYADLEMMLLRQSLFGTERTERVREGGGKHGRVKFTRTVHSFPLPTAVRLHLAHKEKVEAYRARRAVEQPNDAAVINRVRLAMADIRARLGVAEEARTPLLSDAAVERRDADRAKKGRGEGEREEGGA